MEDLMPAVLAQHRLITKTQCGAVSIPVHHRHSNEATRRDQTSYPVRVLRCTEDAGHETLHKDAICCYNFQTFEDWQVVDRKPRTFDACSCGRMWPCETIKAIQGAALSVVETADV